MSVELAAVLGLLAVAIVMFAVDRPRMDAVALLVMVSLPFTGVITMPEALAGFSDANIVLIAALFVIGEGLVRTGVARQLGDWLIARAGSSPSRLIALLMAVVCCLGATMSSTAVTAIFIPVALRISQSTRTAPSQLMMPLSAAALVSGMMTLVATAPNLVVNSELVRRGEQGFHFFSFTPFGIPILGLCILYMLVARRWLPDGNNDVSSRVAGRPRLADWVKKYNLADREYRLRVSGRSPLVGRKLDETSLRDRAGANLVAIQRDHLLIQPTAKTEVRAGDVLLVDLFDPEAEVESVQDEYLLDTLPLTGTYFTDRSQEIGMAEVILPADSDLVGKSLATSEFRGRFGVTVIGLRRGIEALGKGLKDEELKVGDTLLVIGPWKAIRNVQAGGRRDLVVLDLPAEHDDVLPVAGKTLHAVGVLFLVVVLMVVGIVPNVQAALIGCLLMGALGCVDFQSAYRSIDWKTIVLIVGMLPFSLALQRTGGVELASEALMSITSGSGIHGVLAVLFVTTAVLGMFISNTATAVLMAPVSLAVAEELQASPYPFAMIVALAASAAFMTPVSSPVNTLVVTPGGYRFGDFVRIGVPFTLIVMLVSVFMVPWLLPTERSASPSPSGEAPSPEIQQMDRLLTRHQRTTSEFQLAIAFQFGPIRNEDWRNARLRNLLFVADGSDNGATLERAVTPATSNAATLAVACLKMLSPPGRKVCLPNGAETGFCIAGVLRRWFGLRYSISLETVHGRSPNDRRLRSNSSGTLDPVIDDSRQSDHCAAVSRALGDPARLRIIETLQDGSPQFLDFGCCRLEIPPTIR